MQLFVSKKQQQTNTKQTNVQPESIMPSATASHSAEVYAQANSRCHLGFYQSHNTAFVLMHTETPQMIPRSILKLRGKKKHKHTKYVNTTCNRRLHVYGSCLIDEAASRVIKQWTQRGKKRLDKNRHHLNSLNSVAAPITRASQSELLELQVKPRLK